MPRSSKSKASAKGVAASAKGQAKASSVGKRSATRTTNVPAMKTNVRRKAKTTVKGRSARRRISYTRGRGE